MEKTPDGVQAAWRRALSRQHSEPVSSADFGTRKACKSAMELARLSFRKYNIRQVLKCFFLSEQGIKDDLSGGFRKLG
jgi:hypothetical protein